MAMLNLTQFVGYTVFLVTQGSEFEQYKFTSTWRFIISNMMFLLLEELFYSLLYCYGRETFIIRCHLFMVEAMAIGLTVWGFRERSEFV